MKGADLGPASMMCTAIGNGCFAAACFGLVPTNPVFGAWILTAYFVQMVVVASEIRRENDFGANITLIFSSFMFLGGALKIFLSYSTTAWGWEYNPTPSGVGTLIISVILLLQLPVILRLPSCTALMFIALTLTFVVSGLLETGALPESSQLVMGGLLTVATLLPLYEGSANLVNKICGKKVYPIPGALLS